MPGVAACTVALADPKLTAKEWRRRARLLRSRAMHRIAAADIKGAFADLDAAEALAGAGDNPFYRRSMGAAHKLVRGLALREIGDDAAAAKVVDDLVATRPFSRFILIGAALIVSDAQAYDDGLMRKFARLDPRGIDMLYTEAFRRRDFAAVIALHPQLVPPIRVGDKGAALSGKDLRMQQIRLDGQAAMFAAERAGRLAYAFAATGDEKNAEATLTRALEDLSRKTPRTPPKAPALGVKETRAARNTREYLQGLYIAGVSARLLVLFWAQQAAWRIAIAKGDGAKIAEKLLTEKIPDTGAKVDLLLAAAKALPNDPRFAAEAKIVELLTEVKLPPLSERLEAMNMVLPTNESEDDMPLLRRRDKRSILHNDNGFRQLSVDAEGIVTVQFRSHGNQPAPVEELALMRAADMAKDRGKTGFVIRARRDYRRTMTSYYYSIRAGTYADGFETELDLEFVDKNALPAHLKGAEWRVIDAAEVLDALEPFYKRELPPEPPPPPRVRDRPV